MHRVNKYHGFSGTSLAFVLAKIISGEDCRGLISEIGEKEFKIQYPVLIVTSTNSQAEALIDEMSFFCQGNKTIPLENILFFPPWDVLPFDAMSPTTEISSKRIYTLSRLASLDPIVIISPVQALSQFIISKDQLKKATIGLRLGHDIDRDQLINQILSIGYNRVTLVEEPGQVAVRGAVLDLFPSGFKSPVRLELFSDRLESIRMFDSSTQRSIKTMESISILPVREFLLWELDPALVKLKKRVSDLGLPLKEVESIKETIDSFGYWPGLEHLAPLFEPTKTTLLDYFSKEGKIIICDQLEVEAAAEEFALLVRDRVSKVEQEARIFPEPKTAYASAEEIKQVLDARVEMYFERLGFISAEGELFDQAERKSLIQQNLELRIALEKSRHGQSPLRPLIDEICLRLDQNYTVVFVIHSDQRLNRLRSLLEPYGINARIFEAGFGQLIAGNKEVLLIQGEVERGVCIPSQKLLIVSENEVFSETSTRKRSSGVTNIRRFIGSISQLKQDDYIVHIDHGVGIYRGLKQLTVEGEIGDYLHLEYAEGAKLFLPVENIIKVQKYIGSEGKQPTLSKLGTTNWAKAKQKVKEEVAQLAGELINLYAEREIVSGHSFGQTDTLDLAFADRFQFEETPDQSKAIADVFADMAQDKPMDRLVCGDVGYGKTEIALRAAFKAANNGKQVAVLVPTTVLAAQHFATFKARFEDFPIRVGCVSRFFTPAENRKTLDDLAKGGLDIIIGTHRLLQSDVVFKDLGLIIIDEEHRFGVAHKEKLKRFRKEVDVLTLTATPIPRTLHMSLFGIRDLSVIETPPCDRQVTKTYLARYEQSLVREAILRELSREGQVFYIYNRVENITQICDELSQLVPEARITFAHGQLKEQQLEEIMHRFVKKEIDVLVCTTIVESGLDIPNANTILIHNAHKFGLAELYQLRGRVGRSSRRAYAYLLIPNPGKLVGDAKKRLEVLLALDDLGVGFRLALQDMEIRGAGNLLGKDQSGQINAVGYETYSQILKEAVREIQVRKGTSSEVENQIEIDPEIRIGFPAHIPEWYIPDVSDRLLLYQRLVSLKDRFEGEQLFEEIKDRFGDPPREVAILVELMVLRAFLRKHLITTLSLRQGWINLTIHPKAKIDSARILNLIKTSQGNIKISPSLVLSIKVEQNIGFGPAQIERCLLQLL